MVDAAGDRFNLQHGDALDLDLKTFVDKPRAIVANLPYNIATPLLINWLRDIHTDKDAYRSMTLMFQKEVAERIVARLGDKSYGRLAVLSQWLCDVDIRFDVPASAFTPPPKVTSSIIYIQPKQERGVNPSFNAVEKITGEAFGQRRKMIRSSLKKYQSLFDEVGLDETLRAENLSVENFIMLAQKAEERGLL